MTENKSPEKIAIMFNEISGVYDKVNHLATLNIDKKWRRGIIEMIKQDGIQKDKIFDVASGTGDQTVELLRLDPQEILSCDISEGMLEIQRRKIKSERVKIINEDFMNIELKNYFDIITVSFGFRNFKNQEGAFTKMHSLLKPGGSLFVLEIFRTEGISSRLSNLYFGKVLSKFGNKISASNYAYNYLYSSVSGYYSLDEFVNIGKGLGFRPVKVKNNFLKIVNTICFRKHER
ncbi:MAG: menaquinone biosynthesis methyltransferase [Chlorobi bacterium OLB4]|jgi:Methylase involved in ubiquinone/menaquinone biosynthesis|nr:MAG: menaquinone biosynthesis methyltransferase [Chlorobi bacterium OLB4]MBW7856503.1 ubiquinone/menaquinone biosynthesis methyltransferase [Ignavibacteria bacterium]OQY77707.1 MAG: hypothetical protein B6D43_04155 [Ignavibacteriales bacterium UTCHB1]